MNLPPEPPKQQVPGIPLFVAPQLVPTAHDVSTLPGKDADGKVVHLVRLTLWTTSGVSFTFWDGPSAQALGRKLLEEGRAAQTGLTIVGSIEHEENGGRE